MARSKSAKGLCAGRVAKDVGNRAETRGDSRIIIAERASRNNDLYAACRRRRRRRLFRRAISRFLVVD